MDALKRTERHEWILEGLDCANCALKIENGVSKIEGVLDCSVNFVTKTLTMTASSDQKRGDFSSNGTEGSQTGASRPNDRKKRPGTLW